VLHQRALELDVDVERLQYPKKGRESDCLLPLLHIENDRFSNSGQSGQTFSGQPAHFPVELDHLSDLSQVHSCPSFDPYLPS